ncbi:MAG: substrate-binding domain-containing protein [Sphaerochaeta associata]|uniref:substrate-binding domain-containing protein n=1 Tax=Sphaerochaeta associata TaxID=1129264 RepID=UPI002B207A60|nr:substrate-binding domain-containing protein [Sphaerochaeta associata]MEA5106337.1 substrate-binding domain-containing protein [Sphaerochaeta associata]
MQSRHRCIGIFTANLDDEYQSALWHAMEQEAKKRNIGTISFIGSRLGSPIASEASSNLAYHLASEQNIDGLIIIASSLATFFTTVDLNKFFSPWSSLPRVSIGMRMQGMSDITVEGDEGIASLVQHLIEVHHRRRFAILKGPETHEESIRRLSACIQELKAHGIEVDPALIMPGTFTDVAGREAVRYLLDNHLTFDCLVCLNDWMAQGALEELAASGLRVPDDVSVIGFDGLDPSRYTLPPLTTVVQPLYEMGVLAIDVLDRIMAGGEEEHITLPCTAVIRESCGCNPHVSYTPGLHELPSYATPAERLAVQDLLRLMRLGDYHQMIFRLNRALDATASESGSMHRWNEYLSVIEYKTSVESDLSSKTQAMLTGAARALIGDKIGRFQAAKRVAVECSFDSLRKVSAMLSGTFELEQLMINLKQSLHLFGIHEGYLVKFLNSSDQVQLLMTVQDLPQEQAFGEPFAARWILPPVLGTQWKQRRWVLLPLVYMDEPLGYFLVPFGMVMPALYDVLQEQVSSTLKGSLLLSQIRKHEKNLEEQVRVRTQDLLSEIRRRTELEQEVMEISTKTMERIGQDLHDDLCQYLLGISLLASSARQRLGNSEGSVADELESISRHLNEAISKIKTISRGLMPLDLEHSSFQKRLEALVADSLRYAQVEIDVNVDPLFHIKDPTRELNLFRIVQEALTNAIKHSHASHIEISSSRIDGEEGETTLCLTVSDDGTGLPKKLQKRGLGLRIMRNRAAMADAELTIQSSEEGTTVNVLLKEKHA